MPVFWVFGGDQISANGTILEDHETHIKTQGRVVVYGVGGDSKLAIREVRRRDVGFYR